MNKGRLKKIKKFMKLNPEQQLHWALSQAHFFQSLLSSKHKKIIKKFKDAKRTNT